MGKIKQLLCDHKMLDIYKTATEGNYTLDPKKEFICANCGKWVHLKAPKEKDTTIT